MPDIGPKSAQKLALYILKLSKEEAEELTGAIREAKEKIRYCSLCQSISEEETCEICRDITRDRSLICVVEEPTDVMIIEKMGKFKGVYHVLGGAISPLEGIRPEDLKIEPLAKRIKEDKIAEVIVATDPDNEGEATAIYLAKILKPLGVKLTRLGLGLPMGGDLDHTDDLTLSRSLEGRREL